MTRAATVARKGTAVKRKPETPRRPLRRANVERLMHYYHLLQGLRMHESLETVSSSRIAELLDLDDTLVRKDLAMVGVRGCPRVGYSVSVVVDTIYKALGFEVPRNAVLIGGGRLGSAIAAYPGFARYGLGIVAVLDADPAKIGQTVGDHTVRPLDDLAETIAAHAAEVAILTLPAEFAQMAADRAVAAGIRAIWNFAPTQIAVRPGVRVRHEHLSTGFAELAYHLKNNA
jgi:redox-sensing transcriptional repressor